MGPRAPGEQEAASPSSDRQLGAQLEEEIAAAAASPIVRALLASQACMLAVLNRERQIIALDTAYLELLGERDPAGVLGLRPGEAIDCPRAMDDPAGCGCGPTCATCGMAIAVLLASQHGIAEERECDLVIERNGAQRELVLRVRAAPLEAEGQSWTLLTLRDVTPARRAEQLERAFLHDLANLAVGFESACAELGEGHAGGPELAGELRAMARQLVRELQIRKLLGAEDPGAMEAALTEVPVDAALGALKGAIAHRACARGKEIAWPAAAPPLSVRAEPTLLQHVLLNMLINALEATPEGGAVRLELAVAPESVTFRVWNRAAIPPAIAARVFHRYFSTKPGGGRGLGTFAMRLFGERYLGGAVAFTSGPDEGTWFALTLPPGAAPGPRRPG